MASFRKVCDINTEDSTSQVLKLSTLPSHIPQEFEEKAEHQRAAFEKDFKEQKTQLLAHYKSLKDNEADIRPQTKKANLQKFPTQDASTTIPNLTFKHTLNAKKHTMTNTKLCIMNDTPS